MTADDFEQLANDLAERRVRQHHTGSSLTVAEYLLDQWFPAKEASLAWSAAHTRHGSRRLWS